MKQEDFNEDDSLNEEKQVQEGDALNAEKEVTEDDELLTESIDNSVEEEVEGLIEEEPTVDVVAEEESARGLGDEAASEEDEQEEKPYMGNVFSYNRTVS